MPMMLKPRTLLLLAGGLVASFAVFKSLAPENDIRVAHVADFPDIEFIPSDEPPESRWLHHAKFMILDAEQEATPDDILSFIAFLEAYHSEQLEQAKHEAIR